MLLFLKYFVVFFVVFLRSVCQWLHCLCAKLPDYSPGSLFSMSFSFKRSACIKKNKTSLLIYRINLLSEITVQYNSTSHLRLKSVNSQIYIHTFSTRKNLKNTQSVWIPHHLFYYVLLTRAPAADRCFCRPGQ